MDAFWLVWWIPILVVLGVLIGISYSVIRSGITPSAITTGTVTAIVSICLVVGAFVPILTALDTPKDIEYDDYIELHSTVSDITGSLELIEKDGIKYAHAKELGSGTIYYTNGMIDEYVVNKANLDVFLFAGQSNIAYRWYPEKDTINPPNPVCSIGTAYYFGTSVPYHTGIELNECSIHDITEYSGIGRLEMPFSAEYYKLTGHKVLTINSAVGGKSVTNYQPGATMYVRTVDAWELALSMVDRSVFNVSIGGLIWCQGEADTYETIDWYKTRFNAMFDAFKTLDEPITKCYIDLIRPIRGMNSYLAQIELSEENDDIYLATDISSTFTIENGCLFYDDVHYTQKGQNLIGVALAKFIEKLGV